MLQQELLKRGVVVFTEVVVHHLGEQAGLYELVTHGFIVRFKRILLITPPWVEFVCWWWAISTAIRATGATGSRNGAINIDTDIRLAMTGAMRQLLAQQPSEFDPRKALLAAKNAARGIVKARYEAFGCVGQGSKIKQLPLEAMAARYR